MHDFLKDATHCKTQFWPKAGGFFGLITRPWPQQQPAGFPRAPHILVPYKEYQKNSSLDVGSGELFFF